MDEIEVLASQFVKPAYAKQGVQNMRTRQNKLESLLKMKKLPKIGFSDSLIEYTLQELSIMDSNNFPSNCGVGEREGRIYSSLVMKRHYSLSHGIGRSGNIFEEQPKAAGSSIIYKLTTSMAAHALELSGLNKPAHCLILPMATGMTLAFCMQALKARNPSAMYVIWSRIDQKSCFKSIFTAGLIPLVVDNIMVDGQLQTNVNGIEELIEMHGGSILCVLSTTSCFAPRQPDLIDEIARLCKTYSIGHIINNAYGLQCPSISKLINRAALIGRVDVVVQSTDKNFMVPVGGAIIYSPSVSIINEVAKFYPGRASISPILDLFVTLLNMGENGLLELWKERERLFILLKEKLLIFSKNHDERLLLSTKNSISIGVTLESLRSGSEVESISRNKFTKNEISENIDLKNEVEVCDKEDSLDENSLKKEDSFKDDSQLEVSESRNINKISFLGSMLYQRNISGCRVVPKSNLITTINGVDFISWGAHISNYPFSYFTAACSIGLTENEIHLFMDRLEKTWKKYEKVKL